MTYANITNYLRQKSFVLLSLKHLFLIVVHTKRRTSDNTDYVKDAPGVHPSVNY